jgi:hypothetical protein
MMDNDRSLVKCGNVAKATFLFKTSANPTPAMITNMLSGLLDNDRTDEAFQMARQLSLPSNAFVLATIWKICAQLAHSSALDFGRDLFHRMPTTLADDQIVLNSALNMFMKCGDTIKGEEIFSRMNKDLISCSIMMNGLTKCGARINMDCLSRLHSKWRVSTSHRSLLHH